MCGKMELFVSLLYFIHQVFYFFIFSWTIMKVEYQVENSMGPGWLDPLWQDERWKVWGQRKTFLLLKVYEFSFHSFQ